MFSTKEMQILRGSSVGDGLVLAAVQVCEHKGHFCVLSSRLKKENWYGEERFLYQQAFKDILMQFFTCFV